MIRLASPLLLTCAVLAQQTPHPTGPRMTPPTIRVIAPVGLARGMTTEMTVEGFNLAGARRVFFSEPGIKAKILNVKELPDLPDIRLGSNGTPSTVDVGPLPPRNQVTMEVDVSSDAAIGVASFRIETPLGTSPVGSFLIEPYYGETQDKEPNDSVDTAYAVYLPAILAGSLSKAGDVDWFQFRARAGQTLSFENSSAMVGSQLQPVVTIVDEERNEVAQFGADGTRSAETFHYTFAKDGTYYLRIEDYMRKGGAGHFYRIKTGEFPVVSMAYPLGLKLGEKKEVKVSGQHLGSLAMAVEGTPSRQDPDAVLLRVNAPSGQSFNRLRLALGDAPEADAAATKTLTLPMTVNGKLTAPSQEFRFRAAKGQQVVFEVQARRYGSELDSLLEVLDAAGKPVERATVRPVWETNVTLRDHDSMGRGIRIQSWNALKPGDYVQVGSEIIRIQALPNGPDEDTFFESFLGQRIAYFGTSPEAHANDRPVYKVQIHPPGKQFSPNGLPLTRLYYRNDDGGPGYGKDSYLQFTAPADGEYRVRISDVRGMTGEALAYRLSARSPKPDFRLSVNPRNPNVPAGGTIPVTVIATRLDGFDEPVEVTLENLPAGLTATKAVIGKGQNFGSLLLSAAAETKLPEAAELVAVGKATIGGKLVTHHANPEDALKRITITPKPDILMTAETREVELEAGSTAEVTVSIQRQNGFAGRVPVEVRNLPPYVRVTDVGLNGVLLNEDESRRTFTIEALPMAEPVEQEIHVSGKIETRSSQENSYAAPQVIKLRVKPARRELSQTAPPALAGARK